MTGAAMNWPKEIVRMVKVKEDLAAADKQHLWGWHLPEVRASDEELATLEHAIGRPLEPHHREFLRFANGWRSFYQNVDLFGTTDLVGGAKMEYARRLLDATPDEVLKVSRDQLLPIATTLEDRDLFVLNWRTGEVIWLAGEEVERYSNFGEYFAAMIAYNQRQIDMCRG
jgi:hypothetical protein